MVFCTSCGKNLAEGELYCTRCGAPAGAVSVSQPDVSPSHFNSTTTTSQPDPSYVYPAMPEEKRYSGKRVMLGIIIVLALLLVGAVLESGYLGSPAAVPTAINSPGDPVSGTQLYTAYTANQTQASASYTNKTLYIQDGLDNGVETNYAGQLYSYVASGNVVLFWSGQAQVNQLSAGAVVLAKCSVEGLQDTQVGTLLYLDGCDLVSVQSQSSSTSISLSTANE